MPSDGDWRLQGQENHMHGRAMRWAVWTPTRDDWDHDHCVFCSAEISDRPVDDHTDYNAAWVTSDDAYHWVCPACFDDFRERFEWFVVGDSPGA
jgi:hypothetical protein